jgi:hypothetical protein
MKKDIGSLITRRTGTELSPRNFTTSPTVRKYAKIKQIFKDNKIVSFVVGIGLSAHAFRSCGLTRNEGAV